MKIIVCAKQVPDTNEVKIDPVKGTLIRDGVPSILNPDDANALEAALQIKDENEDVSVEVITMGPPQATTMLQECLGMGADNAYLLSDRAFGGADTCATSTTLAGGIKKIGDYDIIFSGRQAIDGDTAQVGPQLAFRLDIPVVTYVQKVVSIKGRTVTVERQLENGYEVIEVQTPCLLTCVKELNTPRYMTIFNIMATKDYEYTVWNHDDIQLEKEQCGLIASPTQVFKSFSPEVKGKGEMLSGTIEEMAENLVDQLSSKHIIK